MRPHAGACSQTRLDGLRAVRLAQPSALISTEGPVTEESEGLSS